MNQNEAFPSFWERHSSSALFPEPAYVPEAFNTQITPHERIHINSMGQGQAVLFGYAYHLFYNNVDMGWIPFDPTGNDLETKARFAFSLLLHNDPDDIMEDHSDGSISLFPNPTNNILNLVIRSEKNTEGSYSIQSLDGRILIGGQKLNLNIGSNRTTINVSQLASGVYLIRVDHGQEHLILKFIKY